MNKIKYFLVVQLLFSLSLCEINNGQRENLLNDFLNYYKSLASHVYQSEEGSLQSRQQVITSGEQLIANPRAQPSAPCDGCASHVNPQAAGVSDLADLGVRHLDLHEPSVKHSLTSVIDVERQVQGVNDVRYILTLSINSNNCTQVEAENCASSKICKTTILVKPWDKLSNGRIIANNCTEEWQFGDNNNRRKRQLVGGHMYQDPTTPEYKLLAEESLRKYAIDSGIRDPLEVARVESVFTQVVAGILTNIDFLVTGSSEPKINKCHSEIWEKAWQNFKQITVTCDKDGHRGKRQLVGGLEDQDPTDPQYQALAEESLHKYKIDYSITQPLRVAQVEKVSTQVVAGSLTRIDFLVSGSSEPKLNKCHSEIWERAWENFKQITVTCEKDGHRGKRQLVGGQTNQDPTKPEYKLLAEESLRKYTIDSGIRDPLEVEQVVSVSTQVVAGLLTRIDFLVAGSSDSKINKCYSKIWEKPWQNFKQITVTCENDGHRGKRQLVGGLEDQDPTDPQYQALAEESLQKYKIDHGITQALRVAKVEKVSTQGVAGSLTRIDFLVSGSSEPTLNKCHSEIWEKGWENFKQITVTCEEDSHRGKRQLGGLEEQDPTDPRYKALAEESLQKYTIDHGITQPLRVAKVEKVSTQVVAGSLTRIDFLVSGSSEPTLNKCHSEIWEKGWENFKRITVTCEIDGHRGKRQLVGGLEDQDPTDPRYKALAEESLQ